MRNTNVLVIVLGLFVSFASSAQAARFLVKNPKVQIQNYVSKVQFGHDTFYVVDTISGPELNSIASAQAAISLQRRLSAESAAPEAEIELVESLFSRESSPPGWHARRLEYDKLPADYSGQNVIVAVIDTGVNTTHPALANHLWTNPNEIPGNNIDDDNNGLVDDVNGYNFVNGQGAPTDTHGHGTHCSGIIAADADGETGSRGVAPGARIMGLKVLGDYNSLANAVLAIKYAVDNGAKILSNSWRLYGSWKSYNPNDTNIALLRSAIEYANSNGVIFVAAAGNESADINDIFKSDTIFPIGYTNIPLLVGVASSDAADGMSYFSNFGSPYVHVAAPGTDIRSTYLGIAWKSLSGTSMATPLVAGSLARGLNMGLTSHEAVQKLIATSDKSAPFNSVISGGIVNLVKFLK